MKFRLIFKKYKLFVLSIFLSLVLVFIDQFTKTVALYNVVELTEKTNGIHQHIKIFFLLNIVLFFNKGISFGMLSNISFMPIILSVIICLISMYILYLLFKNNDKYKSVYLTMIFSGAVGNLIDRFKYGAVVDFIDFHVNSWHFPAFNFADAIISVGVLLILIEEFFLKNKEK